jgi:hypothetical protein
MEAINIQTSGRKHNMLFWTGRVISYLCVAFLLIDAIMKVIMHPTHVEGSAAFGWAVYTIRPIGITLLISTILYIVPRTAILGAMFLTAYFGGAVATMFRVGEPFVFPVIFCLLLWVGLYLRDQRLRALLARS